MDAPAVEAPHTTTSDATNRFEPPPTFDSAMLGEQLMAELGPRLSALMNEHVAESLRKNLDETVALLLSQLDVHVRDIVREAIADKLDALRDTPGRDEHG